LAFSVNILPMHGVIVSFKLTLPFIPHGFDGNCIYCMVCTNSPEIVLVYVSLI